MDATIIDAPASTQNRTQQRDPEMHQVKKGNQWYFGMKAHIGVDAQTGLVHSVATTAIHRCRDRGHFFALAREFWESYRRSFGDLAPVDIESTTVFIWGGLLIARVDGKSPAEYIRDDASRQAIRKLSAHILCENIASVEQSLEKEDNVIAWLESRYLP